MFVLLLKKVSPQVSDYFSKSIKISPTHFLVPHLFTLYTRLFSVKFSQMLIDLFLVQGPLFLIKLGVGIFKELKDKLVNVHFYDGQDQLIRLCENIKMSELLQSTNFTVNFVDLVGDSGLELRELFRIGIPNSDEG